MLLASHEVHYVVSLADSPLSKRFQLSERSKARVRTKSPPFVDETHIQVTIRFKTENKQETEPFMMKPEKKGIHSTATTLSIKGTWECK